MNKMKKGQEEGSTYRSLQILDELSSNHSFTQRDLSERLGIALGLVNSYIKNLISKGFITVKSIPPKRYAYYLTPKGFAEKTRLTYDLLQDYTRIYRETRANLKTLFGEMADAGIKRLVFAGSDEVAEIAYITLKETEIELVGVVDEEAGKMFFGNRVKPVGSISEMDYDLVMVASYLKRKGIYRELLKSGVERKMIRSVFPL